MTLTDNFSPLTSDLGLTLIVMLDWPWDISFQFILSYSDVMPLINHTQFVYH